MAGKKATPSWQSSVPVDMSDDELKQASAALRATIDARNAELAPLNQAWMSVMATIADKFGFQYPGVPALNQLAPYPLDVISAYQMVDTSTTDDDSTS